MIQVINRALNILEYVAKNPKRAHTLSEIANHFNLNHSTCANITKTLTSRNYLEHIGKREGYRLGSMSYYLTNNFSYKKELVDAAKPLMKNLTEVTNEGSILAILRGDTRVIIHEEKSKKELQVVNYPKKNIYATSTGRLILSYMTEEKLKHFVEEYGLPPREVWEEVKAWEDLLTKAANIRKKELSIQESAAHITGIATPIWREDQVVAALGIYMPSIRLNEKNRDFVINQLEMAGKKINKSISGMQEMRSMSSVEIDN